MSWEELPKRIYIFVNNKINLDWGCNSVAEQVSLMCRILALIPSTTKTKNKSSKQIRLKPG
jgi:hypothetical protein